MRLSETNEFGSARNRWTSGGGHDFLKNVGHGIQRLNGIKRKPVIIQSDWRPSGRSGQAPKHPDALERNRCLRRQRDVDSGSRLSGNDLSDIDMGARVAGGGRQGDRVRASQLGSSRIGSNCDC